MKGNLNSIKNPAVLIILDGFGIGKNSPFNAIKNANMPFYKDLVKNYPHSQLLTHGESVGLPPGFMGNSEVGHMTMGAGRVVYQDLSRISHSIKTGDFFKIQHLIDGIQFGAQKTGRVHLLGLFSDGGVHSHLDHLYALIEHCFNLKVPEIILHLITDGRDSPPHLSIHYLDQLFSHPLLASIKSEKIGTSPPTSRIRVGSVMGRFFAMDRDSRWDRVSQAYFALTGQISESPAKTYSEIKKFLSNQHSAKVSDEFITPTLLDSRSCVQEGDSVVFYNFRADRAREITRAFMELDFKEFDRKNKLNLSSFLSMTRFDVTFKEVKCIFPPQNLNHIFAELLESRQLKQLRLAETEKYAHVTFFFNGGKEKPHRGEDRVLIPSSRDVATYDLKPEMSAKEIADRATESLNKKYYDFILINFANADMVGHTGNYAAVIKAMEDLDQCLGKVIGACQKNGYQVILTSDHGNAEEMRDHLGRIHTQHTLNPVPAIWISPSNDIVPKKHRMRLKDGTLADLMPTLCQLMALPTPGEVTGKSLLP